MKGGIGAMLGTGGNHRMPSCKTALTQRQGFA